MDRHEISATFTERGAKGQRTAGADRQKARKALVELSVSSPAAATACKANIKYLRRRSIGYCNLVWTKSRVQGLQESVVQGEYSRLQCSGRF